MMTLSNVVEMKFVVSFRLIMYFCDRFSLNLIARVVMGRLLICQRESVTRFESRLPLKSLQVTDLQWYLSGRVAQWIEHLPSKQTVMVRILCDQINNTNEKTPLLLERFCLGILKRSIGGTYCCLYGLNTPNVMGSCSNPLLHTSCIWVVFLFAFYFL